MHTPFLSVIIPAFNEADRLPATLGQVDEFLSAQSCSYEILVVENGSNDDTLKIAKSMQGQIRNLQVIHEDIRGKGWAVRQGMLAAKGEYRFICDADLSMPIEDIVHFIPPHLPDTPIAIASREAPGAVRYDEPEYRHLIGRAFNLLVRLLLLRGLNDTQCGFKCFRSDAAESIFPLVTIQGWTFDVEALFIGRKLGYEIHEVPIHWYYKAQSRVKVLRDSFQMGLDLVKIRLNHIAGKYHAQIKDR
ncbi:MAG: glycosyltransferase [Chloroflexi bacterium]|nr:glycosyltransferase [Chloroflexota bacterium]